MGFPYFLWAVLLSIFSPLFSFCKEKTEYLDSSNSISYAGMEIYCPWNCGSPFEDPDMINIALLFAECLETTINSGYFAPQFSWEKEDDYAYSVQEPLWEYASIETHDTFLKAAILFQETLFLSSQHKRSFHQEQIAKARKNISLLEQWKGTDTLVLFDEEGIVKKGYILSDIWNGHSIPEALALAHRNLSLNENSFYREESRYEKFLSSAEKTFQEIDSLFKHIFTWCLENHQPEGIAFRTALEDFMSENFDQALEQIRFLVEIAEKRKMDNDLLSKLYLLKGQVESEALLYADAIVGLATAIQKNPSLKEAYFERASVYFELGQFDRAIEDYLASGMRFTSWESSTQLGLGVGAGILKGTADSLVEFVPSMVGMLRGLGSGLWAFSQDPVSASQDFVHAAIQCVEYLRSCPMVELAQDLVPELKELICNYDQLSDFHKGELIGHAIGKYGIDIFLAKYSATAIKAYRDLKRANQIMTLEALASPERTQKILAEAGKRWAIRDQTLRHAELKILESRQGKHIENHPNYKELKKRGEHPSIFEHPDPQRLLHDYAGRGTRYRGEVPGTPDYIEIVDFQEFIGYSVEEETGKKTATTWGKIHYAKGGVHIVPTHPRGK